tara:strand:+ start:510 stop:908 length:399 start_codon:yes stop_codon:yes gene_type:complete
MSEENEKQSAEIIQGPWKESKRKVKLPDKDAIELQETVDFINDLTQTLIVQMIHTIKENEINVDTDSFVRDMSFIIEMVRATLLKEMSLNTNMTKIMDILFEIIFNSGSNIDDLKAVIYKMREEDNNDPEMA